MEIPECPIVEHAGSVVVRAGWYGKPPHRRQRWLCRPTNADPRHRFTPVLTRQGEPHGYCVECSTGLEPWEGQAGARDYRFSAREGGEALAAAAAGASYRQAAKAARRRAHRQPSNRASNGHRRRRDPLRDGQIVANWVDVFTGVVCAAELPRRWPETLLIDSKNFRIKGGEQAGRGFHVLAAMGSEAPEPGRWAPTPRIWRLEPFQRKDQAAWEAFFGSLEGAPRVIVSDADHALACAITSVFDDAAPEHRLCEWHLERNLRRHLPEPILADGRHPVTRALGNAFRTPEGWSALLEAIDAEHGDGESMTLARSWLERYGARITAQVGRRDPAGPNSTGPVEQVLREVDRRVGDRIGSFTNRARMRKLLELMALEISGQADGRQWADRLRERLYLAGGRPADNQRPHDDPKGAYSLIA
jgi:Transposase, Mutator family